MEMIGKFHPLLLHLPIGVLIYASLHWIYARIALPVDRQPNFTFALGLGSLTAIFSAVSGWFLADGGGYDEELLDWHKYLGIATAVGSVGLFWAYQRIEARNTFGAILFTFMGLLTATGHYGGSLTHGVDFLSASGKKEPIQIDDINEAHIFNDLVMPIVENKCVSCHNPQKSKGDLLLHNLDGWKIGGEKGDVLKAGLSLESPLINRIFLPKEDEEHMPPAGKLQLTNEERVFLKWWVDSMSTYEHIVSDLGQSKEVASYLDELVNENQLNIDRPIPAMLDKLLSYGIVAELQEREKPWVDISLLNASSFNSGNLNKLNSIKETVRSIDLSNSAITSDQIEILNNFRNIESINLSNCKIGSSEIKVVADLPKLKVLNLYGTFVDNSVTSALEEIPMLEKVYVWNTKVEADEIRDFTSLHPDVEFIFGADVDQFGSTQLVSPFIVADQDLFEDSLLIRLETKAQQPNIEYALNNQDSFCTYTGPFYIHSTTEIRSKLSMNGWEDSEVVSKTFAKSRYKVASVIASVKANKQYPADGNSTVIDLKKGSNVFGDGKWLGYFGDDVVYTLDLGSVQEISGVTIGTLSDFRSYIHQPKSILIELSSDSQTYSAFAEISDLPTPILESPSVRNHYLRANTRAARYVRVTLNNQKINPPSHSAPGETCWLFVDEILVD